MQDKFLLFLMLQKIIQTKYDLDVIGLIQISPRVYKVKTANHFYCVKIVDEKKLEVAYQHLNTLHLHHFIHLILNNEQHYFTPFQDQYIYLMPYLQEDNHIKKEMKRRKKKFSGGNFKQYKNKSKRIENKSNEDKRDVGKEDNVSLNQIENEKEEFPLILIIVDGFVEFCEETYQRYDDSLYLILREGEKLGIKVMISIESFSGMYISMRIAELFKTKICLYMKDKYAYTEVFDVIQISVFPKAEIPGRGIAYYGERILEFQTALALNVHNDYERREKIKEVLNRGVADGIC